MAGPSICFGALISISWICTSANVGQDFGHVGGRLCGGVSKTADEGPLLTAIVDHVTSIAARVGMMAEAPPAANNLPTCPMPILGRGTRIAAGIVPYVCC